MPGSDSRPLHHQSVRLARQGAHPGRLPRLPDGRDDPGCLGRCARVRLCLFSCFFFLFIGHSATPHSVQGPVGKASEGIARNTLAIFMQPSHDEVMFAPPGATTESARVESWKPGMTFGEFSIETNKKYY